MAEKLEKSVKVRLVKVFLVNVHESFSITTTADSVIYLDQSFPRAMTRAMTN